MAWPAGFCRGILLSARPFCCGSLSKRVTYAWRSAPRWEGSGEGGGALLREIMPRPFTALHRQALGAKDLPACPEWRRAGLSRAAQDRAGQRAGQGRAGPPNGLHFFFNKERKIHLIFWLVQECGLFSSLRAGPKALLSMNECGGQVNVVASAPRPTPPSLSSAHGISA